MQKEAQAGAVAAAMPGPGVDSRDFITSLSLVSWEVLAHKLGRKREKEIMAFPLYFMRVQRMKMLMLTSPQSSFLCWF